jgi:hypothetical protein
MGEATSQIEAHIEDARADFGSNLQDLEQKVRSVTDLKQHFQTRPMTMLGVAFGGGILLATMQGGRKSRRGERGGSSLPAGAGSDAGSDRQHKAPETWDHVKGALIGVAITRFKDFVEKSCPVSANTFNAPKKPRRPGPLRDKSGK